jgi:hypothetical protein
MRGEDGVDGVLRLLLDVQIVGPVEFIADWVQLIEHGVVVGVTVADERTRGEYGALVEAQRPCAAHPAAPDDRNRSAAPRAISIARG